ncbi:hypothetical protein MtrunA17_Chr1g0149191 [Medicago truncatula]|uniref:Uncharacterized protein n=1 Tax=Medicago truncatula TaxID=3880 RepID=A0A396JF87_MEDTR|nr:hypothetical protein MtrunA17_Chr1g0149191 [Medicago truncatula]
MEMMFIVSAHIPKRGRGRRGDDSGSSQATQPEESQVVDPSGVEYLNYQDQVHHDTTDRIIYHKQHVGDDGDIAAAAAPDVLLEDPPFAGEPTDLSLLHSYAGHVALPLWYNSDNVRKLRVVKPINHGPKILSLGRPNGNQDWFWDPLRQSRLHDLVYLGYATVPHALLMTQCESLLNFNFLSSLKTSSQSLSNSLILHRLLLSLIHTMNIKKSVQLKLCLRFTDIFLRLLTRKLLTIFPLNCQRLFQSDEE